VALSEIRALAGRLAIDQPVAVTGGRREERLLAAFLLAEQGLDARPLCEGVEGPGP
jgi:hypothetical protein